MKATPPALDATVVPEWKRQELARAEAEKAKKQQEVEAMRERHAKEDAERQRKAELANDAIANNAVPVKKTTQLKSRNRTQEDDMIEKVRTKDDDFVVCYPFRFLQELANLDALQDMFDAVLK